MEFKFKLGQRVRCEDCDCAGTIISAQAKLIEGEEIVTYSVDCGGAELIFEEIMLSEAKEESGEIKPFFDMNKHGNWALYFSTELDKVDKETPRFTVRRDKKGIWFSMRDIKGIGIKNGKISLLTTLDGVDVEKFDEFQSAEDAFALD